MTKFDADFAVIGAGFAGATAAWELSRQGQSVVLFEARDRVGGRGFARHFALGCDVLEFGGAWITPNQARVRRHAERHGIRLRPTAPIAVRRWHDGHALRLDAPASPAAMDGYRRTMDRVAEDTRRYRAGEAMDGEGRPYAGVSLAAYLARVAATPEAISQVRAWWTISGNGDPETTAATEYLWSNGYGDGDPEGMLRHLQHTLEPGTGALVERMLAASGARVHLGAAVTGVRAGSSGVDVEIAGGGTARVRGLVAALPLNAIRAIAFDPPLPDRQRQAAARGHLGRAVKIWIKARGVTVGTLATGGGEGIEWMVAEREAADGTTLIVGFGLADGGFDPADRHDVAGALYRFFPEAAFVAWDWHDWVNDPWARGTWVAMPADAPWVAEAGTWAPSGRLAFASSDYAHENPGWIEAAIASGERASEFLLKQGNSI